MKETKRHYLPGSGELFVVATPIGNLKDFTVRAQECLEQADAVLCEDTRVTSKLVTALDLKLRSGLERFDAHASPARIA